METIEGKPLAKNKPKLEVSYFPHLRATTPSRTMTLNEVALEIRSDKHKAHCEELGRLKREHLADPENKAKREKYERHKEKLPYFTASGLFEKRNNASLLGHSGAAQIDIDGKDNPGKTLPEIREALENDPHVFLVFMSPGRDGMKGLCRVPASADTHTASHKAMQAYYSERGFVVDTTSDVSRALLMSHDPDIKSPRRFIEAKEYKPLERQPVEAVSNRKEPISQSAHNGDLSADEEAEACLAYISPNVPHDEWVSVGMALKAHGVSASVWDSWSQGGDSYKPGEPLKKWESFNGSGVNFATVVKIATDGNGGRNPILALRNHQAPAKVSIDDFEVIGGQEINAPGISAGDNDKEAPTPTDYYHHNGKYYALDGRGQRYIAINDSDLTRFLRRDGYSVKGDNGEMSAVDRLKAHIVMHNSVDHVGAIAGRSIGLHEDKVTGARHLITRKNNRVEGVPGDWPGIRGILEAQFGQEQAQYIYAWINRARYQLATEQYLQGHALIIAGGVGAGKSLITELIIQPLLGLSAKAYLYLARGNDFNADLVGSEILLLDDEALSRKMEDRRRFGSKLKSIAAGSGSVSCHGKGKDAYSTNPLWRIVVLLNDDEDALGALPPMGEGDSDSLADKVLLLKCHSHKLPFAGEADQSAKLKAMIQNELPAYAHAMDNYTPPRGIRTGDCRFGFDSYQHPELLLTVNANSNERTLLSATDDIFFRADYSSAKKELDRSLRRYYWEGTALEWATLLREEKSHDAHRLIASSLAYGDTATAAGKHLARVAKISNGRVRRTDKRVGNSRLWRIWEPKEEEETPDGQNPF